MDPNETLKELRRLAYADYETAAGGWSVQEANDRCRRYAELVAALDEWIVRGGFLPQAWSKVRSVTVTGGRP